MSFRSETKFRLSYGDKYLLKSKLLSLGMKQCQVNPWLTFSENNSLGDVVKGEVKSITDFGVFIELQGGIDGLVHLSDISWDESEESVRSLNKGDIIEALVMSI